MTEESSGTLFDQLENLSNINTFLKDRNRDMSMLYAEAVNRQVEMRLEIDRLNQQVAREIAWNKELENQLDDTRVNYKGRVGDLESVLCKLIKDAKTAEKDECMQGLMYAFEIKNICEGVLT
jgi:hypothetical protein